MALKKKFYDVEIPLLKQDLQLLGTSIEELNNRNVKLDLTRSLRGKSIELSLIIKATKEKAEAIIRELKITGFFIRRMIRKGTDYVEDSFQIECKDALIRIKPFLITRKKVSRAVRKALRESARVYIAEYVQNKKFEELVEEIIHNKMQKPLSLKLKKIYPLALCEIRILKKIKDKKEEKTVNKK